MIKKDPPRPGHAQRKHTAQEGFVAGPRRAFCVLSIVCKGEDGSDTSKHKGTDQCHLVSR